MMQLVFKSNEYLCTIMTRTTLGANMKNYMVSQADHVVDFKITSLTTYLLKTSTLTSYCSNNKSIKTSSKCYPCPVPPLHIFQPLLQVHLAQVQPVHKDFLKTKGIQYPMAELYMHNKIPCKP